MPGPNHDQVSAGLWLVVGLVVAVTSARYGLGSLDAPDTGFMPFLAGTVIALCAAVGLAEATVRRGRGEGWRPLFGGVAWHRPLIVALALAAYVLALPRAGFVVATALFLGFLFRAVEPVGWPLTVAGSLLATLGAYAVFELWLQAQLPKGPWGF
ncbi:MAG: tripartite tricarboxylate transporter TctB family protein [Candidatus Rokubacteria bacterium]|jgi:hypothetical protein|nr:tripartite tricarboxylate transporter TctB family protein [Candidatus Rokubacteria bacterium]